MLKSKLIRITTVGISLDKLLEGQLLFFNSHYDIIAISREDSSSLNAIKREGVYFKSIPFKRDISFYQDLKCLIQLIRYFRKEKPLIIHSNTPKASLLSMIAGYIARVPIRIYTVTGLRFQGAKGFKRSTLIFFEKTTCYFATKVIPEGNGVKHTLLKNNITKKNLSVILNGTINGIDTTYFSKEHFTEANLLQQRNKLGISSSDFVFLFVGRLVKDKGIVELVNAFVTFQKKNSNSTLLLVGPFEGHLDPLPKNILATIVQHPKIITTGYQDDVRLFFALSDAFVFPSYREGFPNVVLQAAAMKVPCIVSDIIGSNEIIINKINGIIVPSKDTKALSEAMNKLYLDPNVANQYAEKAYLNVTQKYERKQVWDALLKEYKQLEDNLS